MTHRRDDPDGDINGKVIRFVEHMRHFMEVFLSVCSLMNQVTQLSAEEKETFGTLCRTAGRMWRVYFAEYGVTPKMHMLESHCPLMMMEYGCLGDKSEACIERRHNQANKDNRMLCNVVSYAKKKKVQIDRTEQAALPEVIAAQQRVLQGTKRLFTPETLARKAQVSTDSAEAKLLRLTRANNTATAFSIVHPLQPL